MSILFGDSQEFTATPNSGYKVSSISLDGETVSYTYSFLGGNTGPAYYTIRGVTSNGHLVLATFESISPSPSPIPSPSPTPVPTAVPTSNPTQAPTSKPTTSPTNAPTQNPTDTPTTIPTVNPSPTVPEFPSTILIISFLFAVTFLGTVVIKRKQYRKRMR